MLLVDIQHSVDSGGVLSCRLISVIHYSQFATERSTVVVGSCRPCQRSTHMKHVYEKGEFSHRREFLRYS